MRNNAVDRRLRNLIWREEVLRIKRSAADLLTSGQSVAASELFISRSLEALELKLAVENSAYKEVDAAFTRTLARRRGFDDLP